MIQSILTFPHPPQRCSSSQYKFTIRVTLHLTIGIENSHRIFDVYLYASAFMGENLNIRSSNFTGYTANEQKDRQPTFQ